MQETQKGIRRKYSDRIYLAIITPAGLELKPGVVHSVYQLTDSAPASEYFLSSLAISFSKKLQPANN